MRQENVSSDSDQREVYLADAYVLRSPTKTPVPTREMRLDDILEKMPVGRFHYRLLVICGLCFMADAMVSEDISRSFRFISSVKAYLIYCHDQRFHRR